MLWWSWLYSKVLIKPCSNLFLKNYQIYFVEEYKNAASLWHTTLKIENVSSLKIIRASHETYLKGRASVLKLPLLTSIRREGVFFSDVDCKSNT